MQNTLHESSELLEEATSQEVIPLSTFIQDFGKGLLEAVQQQNPSIYDGIPNQNRLQLMNNLLRKPFEQQQEVVQAITRLLVDNNQPAAIINAEMGTGKTMMAISTASVMHAEGYKRTLVISPPHLVYKWRREIKATVENARVWILNGPDTLRKLLELREMRLKPTVPEFFIMGRVRMRMGFNWKPAFIVRKMLVGEGEHKQRIRFAACPSCGGLLLDEDGSPVNALMAEVMLNQTRTHCKRKLYRKQHGPDGVAREVEKICGERFWTLVKKDGNPLSSRELVAKSLCQIPTIGDKTANALLNKFGTDMLSGMLSDNVYEFINLMDEDGELYFSDRQAKRMERALANTEFSFGQGGYQPTEFIKRYLPQGYFGLLVVDEGHEYKNENSAQGQAMGVLASKCTKSLLLTGTLMGGYADDLFYLLHRLNPSMMIEDGFGYNERNSLGTASMSFLREHGILKDIFKETDGGSHRTARAKNISHRTSKGPGFGPMGIMRYVLPITAFLKLKDIGGDVLPPYEEFYRDVAMTGEMEAIYKELTDSLISELKEALRKGDTSLLGVVLNVLLAWPDTCFRDELVRHPRTRQQIAYLPAVFDENMMTPKELELLSICRANKLRGRRTLVYTTYTGTRDTAARLKNQLDREGFKVAVLRSSVEAVKREDWLFDQVDRGVDIIITNPELVKTGLDMLEFPTIVFMQSGYNVYTVQQAARRSWRIGQTEDVEVFYLGYANSAQTKCLELMAKKIAVSQSTSGDMPDSGLDVLNQSGDSIEVALAKKLIH